MPGIRWLTLIRKSRRYGLAVIGAAAIIATYGDQDGSGIFPGQARLALDGSVSERQFSKHLARLLRDGWLTRVPGRGLGRGKGRAPAGYALRCPVTAGTEIPPVSSAELYSRNFSAVTTGTIRSTNGEQVRDNTNPKNTSNPPPPSANAQVAAAPAMGGGDELSDKQRAGLLRWIAAPASEGGLGIGQPRAYLARVIANGNLAVCLADYADAVARARAAHEQGRQPEQPAERSDLTLWERMPQGDSAGQVALAPSQSSPADPAPTPPRLAMCPDCQRTLRLDGGRYPEHDGNGGRRCPSSGAVSYLAAAAALRRAV